jgi:hypothetical protein
MHDGIVFIAGIDGYENGRVDLTEWCAWRAKPLNIRNFEKRRRRYEKTPQVKRLAYAIVPIMLEIAAVDVWTERLAKIPNPEPGTVRPLVRIRQLRDNNDHHVTRSIDVSAFGIDGISR